MTWKRNSLSIDVPSIERSNWRESELFASRRKDLYAFDRVENVKDSAGKIVPGDTRSNSSAMHARRVVFPAPLGPNTANFISFTRIISSLIFVIAVSVIAPNSVITS